jgi:hypothetical protein
MKTNNRKFRVVTLLLPIFIFLIFISASYAKIQQKIQATIRILPTATTKCFSNPLIVGNPKEKVVTCYIELDNVHPSKIIPSTIRLSLVEKLVTPIPVVKNSPNKVGDFDKDGIPDLKVTFNKTIVDSWFSTLDLPTNFTFNLTGEITGIPDYRFTSTDKIEVINPSYTFVYFNGRGGDVKTIKGIDITKATITNSIIDRSGHQLVRLDKNNYVRKWEDITGTVTGTVPIKITSRLSINLPFTAWVRYSNDNCVFTSNSSLVCDGRGMFFKRGLAVGYSSEDVNVHFETDGKTATLTAKKGGITVFEQSNVPLTDFEYVVKTKSPFLFFG